MRTFFITTRAFAGKPLFQTDRMALLFIDVLRSYTLAKKFKVREFVVMPNHVHLLITVDAAMSIERAVQLMKGSFSYRAKKEVGVSSEVWQRGFSDMRVNDEASFVAYRSYIHDNPVKAGLVSRAEDYPFGSLHLRQSKLQGLKPAACDFNGTTEVVP